MLIARAPVRVSFFGGGTDLPAYYERHGGALISTTIDRYVYVIVNSSEGRALQITSSDYRQFYRHQPGAPLLWDGDLSLPKAVLQHFGVEEGASIFLASEVPPGTGLGSSSSVTVALVKAISTACGYQLAPAQVAELACDIEIGKLAKPIGVQDQYAAAFGGLNWLTFNSAGVSVERLVVPPETVARLESNLLLMFTGAAHDSAEILARQGRSSRGEDPAVVDALQAVRELADTARVRLERGDVEGFGCLLHDAWQQKKRFDRAISSPHIDRCYDLARTHGALGGKIAGAGGGGFLLLYCADGARDRVARVLHDREGLQRLDFHFERDGARVLFNAGLRLREKSDPTLRVRFREETQA